ncbi:MAG: sulfotransferase [Chitinophagales bacterium]|nr:sulfotransferase [Chitinophagales bacterium]
MEKKANFFVVGTVKGGTTSLHRYLDQHPEIYMSPVKETNFFSRFDIDEKKFSKDYAHDVNVDLKKYLDGNMAYPIHIAHVTEPEDYTKLFKNVKNESVLGEISNSYLLYEHAPKEIFKYNPEAKIAMILRNPVERAFSQYVMNLRLGKTLEKDFLKEIRVDDAKPEKGWGANHQYLMVGMYAAQVKRYLSVFNKEQIRVYLYEDYKKNQRDIVKDLYRFLGVSVDFEVDMSEKLNEAGVPKFKKLNYLINQIGIISWAKRNMPRAWREPFKKIFYSNKKDEIPTIQPHERKWLLDYYMDDIKELEQLLGVDLSNWYNNP